jgi:hypothetical protein
LYQVFVQSFPEPRVKQQVSTSGVSAPPRWSRDGRELFYVAPDSTVMTISVKTAGAALQAGAPRPLFKAPLSLGVPRREYDVAPDGRFLINVPAFRPADLQSIPITVVLNWRPDR